MNRTRLTVLFVLALSTIYVRANLITATPSNYTSFLASLQPGDTLYLTAGTYTNNLTLSNLNGTSAQPIVIMGSANLYSTQFNAQSCCNTISITQCSYLVIKNLQLDGMGLAVDGVKGEGTAGNWAHHITLEYLNIINYGNNQQIVGISTKCHAWDWVIRKNRIIGAGTGMYLGNSNGDKPFVNGLIENNYVANTVGYNIEIKHQSDTVRDNFAGTNVSGKTIIRYNVFTKELNGSTGASARPALLVGGFPLTGAGSTDYYEIYRNFFYENPNEALFQGTGNIMLYENIFVNHSNPSGYRAVYIRDQNGVQPQNIKVWHNTIWANNASGGLRMFNPNTSYSQYCYGNAVFAPNAISGFVNSVDNITDSYANAGVHVLSATTSLATLDLYPKSGQLTGTVTPNALFQAYTDWDKDFNGATYSWNYRGAYSGCCSNPGWQLQLDTMNVPGGSVTAIATHASDNTLRVVPNPGSGIFRVMSPAQGIATLMVRDLSGREVYQTQLRPLDTITLHLSAGIYLLSVQEGTKVWHGKVIIE